MSLKNEWGSPFKSFAKFVRFGDLQNNPSIHVSYYGLIIHFKENMTPPVTVVSFKHKRNPLEHVVMLTITRISYSIRSLKCYSHQSEGSLKVRTILHLSLNPHYLAHWTCTECSSKELYFTKPLCWWRCHSKPTGETCSNDPNISHEWKDTAYVLGQYNCKRSCGCWDGSSDSPQRTPEMTPCLSFPGHLLTTSPGEKSRLEPSGIRHCAILLSLWKLLKYLGTFQKSAAECYNYQQQCQFR